LSTADDGFLEALPSIREIPSFDQFCAYFFGCPRPLQCCWLVAEKISQENLFRLGRQDLRCGLSCLKGCYHNLFCYRFTYLFVPSKSNLITDSKLAPTIINSYQSIVGLLSPGAYQNLKKQFVGQKERIEKAISERSRPPPGQMDTDRLAGAIRSLVELVTRLRGPGGCPWDAKQTDSTIKIYLLEEAYEVLDALEDSSPEEVCSELGDLLFQILFLAQLASERGEFDFNEVVEGITEKMTRRHPHVFGNTRVESAEDVSSNWVKIKRTEKGKSKETSFLLQSIPSGLPALFKGAQVE